MNGIGVSAVIENVEIDDLLERVLELAALIKAGGPLRAGRLETRIGKAQ